MLRDVPNGGELRSIDATAHPALRRQATLSTNNPLVTPMLKNWRVNYTFRCTP